MFRMIFRSASTAAKAKLPMSVYGVEGSYVAALYNAALQKNQLEDVEKHFRKLLLELKKDTMKDFVETSMIPIPTKSRVLKEVGEEIGMPDTAINLLQAVTENGRLKLLKRIIIMFLDVMTAHRNEALCEVVTAEPLDESSRKKLLDAIKKHVKEGKKIILNERVDPDIIGGMIVGIEDSLIDMSISSKIKMYAHLLNQPA